MVANKSSKKNSSKKKTKSSDSSFMASHSSASSSSNGGKKNAGRKKKGAKDKKQKGRSAKEKKERRGEGGGRHCLKKPLLNARGLIQKVHIISAQMKGMTQEDKMTVGFSTGSWKKPAENMREKVEQLADCNLQSADQGIPGQLAQCAEYCASQQWQVTTAAAKARNILPL